MKRNRDVILVKHILDSMRNIEEFTTDKNFSDFKKDRLLQSGIVREVMIIGEAAANLSDSFKDSNPKVPFHKIIGMRNILVHAYWEIDEKVVWKVCKKSLPELKEKLLKIV